MNPAPRRRPSLDPWREELVLALRSHDVTGVRIGDALAEVDAHCAESGQSPEQAFGPPHVYGASLAESLGPESSVPATPWWRYATLAAASGAGVLFLLAGVDGLAHGRGADLDTGMLLVLALVAVFGAILPRLLPVLLRRGRRRYLVAVLFVVIFGAATLADLLADRALRVPAGPVLVTGGVLLVGSLAAMARATPDVVVDPRTGRDALRTPPWVGTALAIAMTLVVVLAVAVTVAQR